MTILPKLSISQKLNLVRFPKTGFVSKVQNVTNLEEEVLSTVENLVPIEAIWFGVQESNYTSIV